LVKQTAVGIGNPYLFYKKLYDAEIEVNGYASSNTLKMLEIYPDNNFDIFTILMQGAGVADGNIYVRDNVSLKAITTEDLTNTTKTLISPTTISLGHLV
jgi:hypothetical protein